MKFKHAAILALAVAPAFALAQGLGVSPSSSVRYATDAYPGFDDEAHILPPEKKEPGLFSWWSGPKMDNPKDQLDWARECAENGSWRKAKKAYDALVAEWPASPEAPVAQEELADLYFSKYNYWSDAFAEYRYLLDFYSGECDYDKIAERMYETAKLMREEGKKILFFRIANSTEVRRAFEAVVRRAPGAVFASDAMVQVAELREEEGELDKAVEVYENIRNLFPGEEVSKKALMREAEVRMKILRKHSYNRPRAIDTSAFLRLALASNPGYREKAELERWLEEAVSVLEEDAYRAAKFYDSKTRTRESAINAYEKFLIEYPASKYVGDVRDRLSALKEGKGK